MKILCFVKEAILREFELSTLEVGSFDTGSQAMFVKY